MQSSGKKRSEFWKQELERFNRSEMTAQAYCASRGLGYASFCAWRRRLKAAGDSSQGVTIPVLSPRPQRPSAATEMIRVEFGGMSLSLPPTTDPRWLAAVLVTLRC